MYLILTGALWPWIQLPDLGNIGFTVVLFAVFHCAAMEGARRTLVFFATSAVVSYLMEEIGVRTGFIFGAYLYSNQLGPKTGHVPLLIPLAWFMMVYPAWVVAGTLVSGLDTRSIRGLAAQSVVGALVISDWVLPWTRE
jgi:putative membrane protein